VTGGNQKTMLGKAEPNDAESPLQDLKKACSAINEIEEEREHGPALKKIECVDDELDAQEAEMVSENFEHRAEVDDCLSDDLEVVNCLIQADLEEEVDLQ